MKRSVDRHRSEARQQLAREAARLLFVGEARDAAHALRKAAERLGIRDPRAGPQREEIDAALREQQRLFAGDRQPAALHRLRLAALEALLHFRQFRPELFGAVLDGTADDGSPVQLLLYDDDPDAPLRLLLDAGTRYRLQRMVLHADRRTAFTVDALRVETNSVEFVLHPLPGHCRNLPLRWSPEGPLLARASREQLAALLAAEDPAAVRLTD